MGPIKWFGKGIKAAGELVGKKPALPPLSDLKDKLGKSLRELGHRFIITIDEVDRLEPAEVVEILRLVRSVVDLPNVIYLLCYDSEILAHSIEKAVGVKSGQSYLEKMVQLTVMVPKPESLQLRQWFSDELHLIASAKDEDELSRLKVVIDYEGGRQLQTPRSVVQLWMRSDSSGRRFARQKLILPTLCGFNLLRTVTRNSIVGSRNIAPPLL